MWQSCVAGSHARRRYRRGLRRGPAAPLTSLSGDACVPADAGRTFRYARPDGVIATNAGKTSWWRPWRIAVAAAAAVLIAAVAFLFRFNSLGGSLGGFDNDHFIYL